MTATFRICAGSGCAISSCLSLQTGRRSLSGRSARVSHPVAVLEAALESQHGLRVELADAALGDAEHLADLLQAEVVVVVERDHDPLALGQAGDRVGQGVA